jgi:hypothetical protein
MLVRNIPRLQRLEGDGGVVEAGSPYRGEYPESEHAATISGACGYSATALAGLAVVHDNSPDPIGGQGEGDDRAETQSRTSNASETRPGMATATATRQATRIKANALPSVIGPSY